MCKSMDRFSSSFLSSCLFPFSQKWANSSFITWPSISYLSSLSLSSLFVLSSFMLLCSRRMIGRESWGRRWKIPEGPSRSGYANWASLIPHVLSYKHIDHFDRRACSFLRVCISCAYIAAYVEKCVESLLRNRFSAKRRRRGRKGRRGRRTPRYTSSFDYREHIRVSCRRECTRAFEKESEVARRDKD